ncbi:glycosyltransferase family 4 protein [Desulfotalea psychrophila]|uniref:Related to glycosyl transferase n=1 Tax=Desulfotalea psychrophila (strain LSv54 / DSM 12343) TaxID=177439 RepID=Q6AQM4_DESPS|nr:glycosyltransferase family 4 protein [Desulfotalea psychrophila]CAG35349.1 related to glycosyl transferase [Desulfotalea psychrophila LSv54]
MKIIYYMPFKALDHPTPSGDLIIGRGIFAHLSKEHQLEVASSLRLRWLYRRPGLCWACLLEILRITRKYRKESPDIWLSYHSYYKAPDILGALCSRRLGIPYLLFQGIYSTKRRKKLSTLPGFLLNRYVLRQANLVITNKRRDYKNLRRLLPEDRLLYIAPGIYPEAFYPDATARTALRQSWGVPREGKVIISAAMFRPDVKSEGIKRVIASMITLKAAGKKFLLVLIGDGLCREELEAYARPLEDQVIFMGRIERNEIYRYFSAADLFIFPGIHEALGMVYLEAQSCGLPVIAYGDWGAGEAVIDGETGLLSSAQEPEQMTNNITYLLEHDDIRRKMGKNAQAHIRCHHDIEKNYAILSETLEKYRKASAS